MAGVRETICEKCHRAYPDSPAWVHYCPDPEYAHRSVTSPVTNRGKEEQMAYASTNVADFSPKHDPRPTLEDLQKEKAPIRKFETGATRDTAEGKLEFSEFFSVEVLEARAQYMHKHRIQPDGSLRAGGNWRKGIPQEVYMASLYRHFVDVWKENCGIKTKEGLVEALCAVMFNAEGMLYELLKEKKNAQ